MTECVAIVESPNIEYTEYIPGNMGHVSQNTKLKIVDINTGQSLGPDIDREICLEDRKCFRDISIILRPQKRL